MPKRTRSNSRGFKRRRPYRSGGKRSFKKRRVGGPSKTIVRSTRGNPFSDQYYCRMRYCYGVNVSTASGVMQDHIIRINSLYDPEYAVGGHQPFGRDNMASLYNKYRVFGMKYKVTIWNTDTAVPLLCAVHPSNKYTSDTTFNTIAERGYAKHKVVPPLSANGLRVIKGYASMAKVHGVNKSVIKNDDTFAAFADQDPAREAYLHVYAAPIDAISTITVRYRIELCYMAQWFDRIPITGS